MSVYACVRATTTRLHLTLAVTPPPHHSNMRSMRLQPLRESRTPLRLVPYSPRPVGIPAGFRGDGTLSPGASLPSPHDVGPLYSGHAATMADVFDKFVQPYDDSAARSIMWKELTNFADAATRLLGCVTVLVGGEFVMDLDEPANILIVLDVPASEMEQITGFARWVLARLFNGREASITNDELSIYTEIIQTWPEGHHRFEQGQANRERIHTMLRSPVETTREAGHLSVWHCPSGGGDASAVFFGGDSGANRSA